jgi:hypothetical protein
MINRVIINGISWWYMARKITQRYTNLVGMLPLHLHPHFVLYKTWLATFHSEVGFDCVVLYHEWNEILSSSSRTLRFIRKRVEKENLERRNMSARVWGRNILDYSTRTAEAEDVRIEVCSLFVSIANLHRATNSGHFGVKHCLRSFWL